MSKYPSEIFGHPSFVRSAESETTRAKWWCPFVDKRCYKQSRLVESPFGVCTAHYHGSDIAICPRRFLDEHRVFDDIARHYFGDLNNVLLFPEVRLPHAGTFDFVMVKHRPVSSEVEDFVAIEFQTGQTTGTGDLVAGFKDFMAGADVTQRTYAFGLNTYDIWKRTFTQVLNKGVILENWRKKIYWVVQDPIYCDFEQRYNLQGLDFNSGHSTVFALYDLVRSETRYELAPTRMVSATVDQLFAAFRNNPNIPSLDDFLRGLHSRMQAGMQIQLRLDGQEQPSILDVRPPTSTGMIRDADVDDWTVRDEGEMLL